MQTPWGQSDAEVRLAEGIVRYKTPTHGGIKLSPSRLNGMPTALREMPTFAGDSWYEEDLDWGLVVLSFPDEFDPNQVYNAHDQMYWRSLRPEGASTPQGQLWHKWQGPERMRADEIAAHYLNDRWSWWVRGSCESRGNGWAVFFRQLGIGRRARRKLTSSEFILCPEAVEDLPGLHLPLPPGVHTRLVADRAGMAFGFIQRMAEDSAGGPVEEDDVEVMDHLPDLICNLLHLADSLNYDPQDSIDSAWRNYEAEQLNAKDEREGREPSR